MWNDILDLILNSKRHSVLRGIDGQVEIYPYDAHTDSRFS
jgi:hypothetical protein